MVYLALVQYFSNSLQVKTFINQAGDLVIVGIDHEGNTDFQFCVKSCKTARADTVVAMSDRSFDEFGLMQSNEEQTSWKLLDDYQTEQVSIMSRFVSFRQSKSLDKSKGNTSTVRSLTAVN